MSAIFPLLLLLLSGAVTAFLSSPATAQVFFSTPDVVFAAPTRETSSLRAGDGVVFLRANGGGGERTGEGTVFRIRKEHMTILVTSGTARNGDRIIPGGSGTYESVHKINPGDVKSIDFPAAQIRGARRVYVYKLSGAPAIVGEKFDRDLARTLADGLASATDFEIVYAEHALDRAPAAADVALMAKTHSADRIVVPEYRASRAGEDEIIVSTFDGPSGAALGSSSQAAPLFQEMLYTKRETRVGGLVLLERYSGIEPAPTAVRLDESGAILMTVGSDVFRLMSGRARYAPSVRPFSGGLEADLSAGRRAMVERTESTGLSRVVILDGDTPKFGSALYPEPTTIHSQGDELIVLRGATIERLRVEEGSF